MSALLLKSLILAMAVGLAGTAAAKKDNGPGNGHGNGHAHGKHKHAKSEGKGKAAKERPAPRDVRVGAYFTDGDRDSARRYYAKQYGGSRVHCPPGLAKKNNGCLPPGQAKKYAVGQPLPAGVVTYPVPQPVLVQLPPAPPGHKYVRVATDILLIAVGTSMVVDGITDLLRL